jgi:hypothetical protein
MKIIDGHISDSLQGTSRGCLSTVYTRTPFTVMMPYEITVFT